MRSAIPGALSKLSIKINSEKISCECYDTLREDAPTSCSLGPASLRAATNSSCRLSNTAIACLGQKRKWFFLRGMSASLFRSGPR